MMMLRMAWRNIWRNKARSLVIMLSVAFGLFAGVGVLALYKGMMTARLKKVVYSEVSHLQLHHPEFKKQELVSLVLPDGDSLLQDIRQLPGVWQATGRSIVQGMLVTATGSTGVQIIGVSPESENKVSGLERKLIMGSDLSGHGENEILVGQKLADKMKLTLRSKLVLTFTDSSDNLVSAAFRIKGIYNSGNTPIDEVVVYVSRPALNKLLLTGEAIHEIAVILNDGQDPDQIQQTMIKRYPGVLVETWKQLSPETDLMIRTVDDYSYIIMMIILLALAFGIINTMLMSVLERTREIGMMSALGTSRRRIFSLVLLESVFLSVAGSPVGLLTAYLITAYYARKGLDLSGMGKDMMSSFGFETTIYPAFPWEKLISVLVMVISTALLSSLLPAWRALRMRPVDALKK